MLLMAFCVLHSLQPILFFNLDYLQVQMRHRNWRTVFLKVKTLCVHCVDSLSQGLFWGTHWNLRVNLCWTQVVGYICWWTPGLCALELTTQGPGVPQPLETPPEKCVQGNACPFQMLNILIRAVCILHVISSEMVAVLNICDSNIAQRLVNV